MKEFLRCLKTNLKNCGGLMIIGLIVVLCLEAFFETQEPRVIGKVLSSSNIQDVLNNVILFIGIAVCNLAIKYIGTFYSRRVEIKSYSKIYREYFEKLIHLDYSHHIDMNSGIVINQIENAASSAGIITTMIYIVPSILTIVITMKYIIQTSIQLSGIIVVISLILIVVCKKVSTILSEFTEKLHKLWGLRKQIVDDSISGFSTILLTNNVENMVNNFNRVNNTGNNILCSKIKTKSLYRVFFILVYYLITISILIIGANNILKGNSHYSDIYSIIMYTTLIINNVTKILDSADALQNAIVGFRKYEEIMKIENKIIDGNVQLKSFNDNISINNMAFRYDDSDDVIKNINLKISKGKHIGICGPSGSGKSTIIKLLTRFYDATEGSIEIDGIDIKDLTMKSLRKIIGVVEQNPFLFNDTILNNIRFGNPSATDLDVYEAAKKANIHEFVLSLKDGYNSMIGKNGIKLSGGQRQRIAIARLFLQNPDIIIFDEATSALDNTCENIVMESIDKLSDDKTVIIIAHRLTTIESCDEILVVDNHKIVERGNHEYLESLHSKYYELLHINDK